MISVVFAAAILLSDAAPVAATAPVPAAAPEAAAPTTVAPATVAAAKPKVDRNTVVCHIESEMGSRIPKKICYSQAQADDRSQQDALNLERMQAQHGAKSN